jgi:hypothetical protein
MPRAVARGDVDGKPIKAPPGAEEGHTPLRHFGACGNCWRAQIHRAAPSGSGSPRAHLLRGETRAMLPENEAAKERARPPPIVSIVHIRQRACQARDLRSPRTRVWDRAIGGYPAQGRRRATERCSR